LSIFGEKTEVLGRVVLESVLKILLEFVAVKLGGLSYPLKSRMPQIRSSQIEPEILYRNLVATEIHRRRCLEENEQ